MKIPEERVHLHFATMMIDMAWNLLSDIAIEANEEEAEKAAWEKYERYSQAQTAIWCRLSTDEREFYNYVYRQARLAEELRSTITSWQSEVVEDC
ncbi:MAG TPA: hypothetical protein VFA98_13210 [Thermoanaerobaculia bacterium]|jgi:hypothetical protein|nr:hypothetical protein [Thermoanaerobaculia bacterium]